MSKIDKLNVMGIRSFPLISGMSISFQTPLTLITGVNGSGKTTIVECLKYATTGLQPPNTKGGAFIHDPKLTGEREVMAQVKLQFRSVKGDRLVVTRSLQLTVKKTTRTLKTLESSLVIDRKVGEKSTVSSKAIEMDGLIPTYMGVAAAVLDNVIFCHQEESMWPLSEPSALKKKFDEIFQAQQYTKAIDQIKKIRKSQNEELGKMKIIEEHAKQDKERANRARDRSIELSRQIEELRELCKELQLKGDNAQAKADKLSRDAAQYHEIIGTLSVKRQQAESKQEIINNLREHLKELSDPDDVLERNLAQFNAIMSEYTEERDEKKTVWLELSEELAELGERKNGKLAEKGQFQQEADEHQRQLGRRKVMIKEVAAQNHLYGFDDLDDSRVVEEFLYKIQKLSTEHATQLEKDRNQSDREKQGIMNAINRLAERKEALHNSKLVGKQQIEQSDKEASEYSRRVNKVKVDEGSKAVVESRIEDVNNRLGGVIEAAMNASWDSKLKEANQQLRNQEDEGNRLNNALVQDSKRAGEVARLAHLKQELKEKKRSLETLLSAHTDRINKLLGNAWTAKSIEDAHKATLEASAQRTNETEKARDKLKQEMEQVSFRQKTLKDDISQKTREARELKDAISKAIGDEISEYDHVLEEAQKVVDDARDRAKGFDGLSGYFENCLTTLSGDHPSCRTCQRSFKSSTDPALRAVRKRLEGLIQKAKVQSNDVELPAAEAEYKTIAEAGSSLKVWKKLTEQDIPALETGAKGLAKERDLLVSKLEKEDKQVVDRRTEQKDLESIARTVSSIARCDDDIQSYSGQIEELSAKQSQRGSTRTLEELQDEIASLNRDMQSTKQMISNIHVEQDASKSQKHELELELRDFKNELNTVTAELEKKAGLLARVEEYRKVIQTHRDAIDKAEKDIQDLEPQIEALQVKYEDVGKRWASELAEQAVRVRTLSDTVSGLKMLNDQIRSYIDRAGEDQLAKTERDIMSIDQQHAKVTKTQTQLTKEIGRLEEQLRDSDNTKRQYSDNLQYRRESHALDQLNADIEELTSRNAEVDRDRFLEQSRQATRDFQHYHSERQGKLGQMKAKDLQLVELLKDFETDLKDAPARFQEARIKVTTTKAAISDLQIYGGALDNAILKFHGIKMEQVNDIIGELWVKTYKGSDVDKIMILSDHDSGGGSTAARGRSYNYRVVMVKGGVEMDMRGRCSAGQKVLASIIIRLALADVFSQDCGLIALDEPTTNLDQANVIALAESLHDLIEERQRQANFQLVIITHDEEFLRAMQCADFTDVYYKVSRDRNANSMIMRVPISELDR